MRRVFLASICVEIDRHLRSQFGSPFLTRTCYEGLDAFLSARLRTYALEMSGFYFCKHGFVHLGFKTRKRSRIRHTLDHHRSGPSTHSPTSETGGIFTVSSCTGKMMKQTALYRNQVVRIYLIIGIKKKSPVLPVRCEWWDDCSFRGHLG